MKQIYAQEILHRCFVNIQDAASLWIGPVDGLAVCVCLRVGKAMHYDNVFPKTVGPKRNDIAFFQLNAVIVCSHQHKRVGFDSGLHAVCQYMIKPIGKNLMIDVWKENRPEQEEG